MKRYLIFGFLTILIITLNFTFIIILVTENVRINYNILFFLWLLVILASAGLAYLEKTKKVKPSPIPLGNSPEEDRFMPTEEFLNESVIYSSKGIKTFEIQLSSSLNPKGETGFFGGFVVTEKKAGERVQAIYTTEKQLLGYINKTQQRLCENIEQLYREPLICWGMFEWQESEKSYTATIYLPILYDQPEMSRFKKLVNLKQELLKMEKSHDAFDIYSYLEKAEEFRYLQQSGPTTPTLNHVVDPGLISSLSEELVEEQKWEALLKLKKHPLLLDLLKPTEKKEVLTAIKKAKKELEKKEG